nr:hypothetical protein [Pandoravirus belohorizontensis]
MQKKDRPSKEAPRTTAAERGRAHFLRQNPPIDVIDFFVFFSSLFIDAMGHLGVGSLPAEIIEMVLVSVGRLGIARAVLQRLLDFYEQQRGGASMAASPLRVAPSADAMEWEGQRLGISRLTG